MSKRLSNNPDFNESTGDFRPLVMHMVYRFAIGGLENGVVNLINRMDSAFCRHMVVSITECDETFCRRVKHSDVIFHSLHKGMGHGYKIYPLLYRLFREYRPAILHTRNLAALETVVPAWVARVPVRIHGEHGWDVNDPGGTNARYSLMRRLYRPFVHHFIGLSEQIAYYLGHNVGVKPKRLTRICNGVDTTRFRPVNGDRAVLADSPFNAPHLIIMGTVGRLSAIKDQITLVRAFAEARKQAGEELSRLRLIIAGDGSLRNEIEKEISIHDLSPYVWLAGERSDVSSLMQTFDFFVLPSLAEGISNVILEAMASGLAVVATDVGGNAELVIEDKTGSLVPARDPVAMASAITRLAVNASKREQLGKTARMRIEAEYSLDGMVGHYMRLYQSLMDNKGNAD